MNANLNSFLHLARQPSLVNVDEMPSETVEPVAEGSGSHDLDVNFITLLDLQNGSACSRL